MTKGTKAFWVDDQDLIRPLEDSNDKRLEGTHGYNYAYLKDENVPNFRDDLEYNWDEDPDADIAWALNKVSEAMDNNWVRVRNYNNDYGKKLDVEGKRYLKPAIIKELANYLGLPDDWLLVHEFIDTDDEEARYDGSIGDYATWYKQRINGLNPDIAKRLMELNKYR